MSRRFWLRWGGAWLLALVFFACDPHGCSCGTSPSCTYTAPSCTYTAPSYSGCGGLFAARDAGPIDASLGRPDANLPDATNDAHLTEAGCMPVELGTPCPTGACVLGFCTVETTIAIWDADAGVASRGQLSVPICELSPTTTSCPCGSSSRQLSIGSATPDYGTPDAICLADCRFDPHGPGDCEAPLTCDPFGACRAPCASDDACQLRARDVDGDGTLEWVVDPTTGARCSPTTGRCVRPGRAGAAAGDPCTDDHDCMADGYCAIAFGLPGTGTCTPYPVPTFVDAGTDASADDAGSDDAGADDAGSGDAGADDAGDVDAGTDGG